MDSVSNRTDSRDALNVLSPVRSFCVSHVISNMGHVILTSSCAIFSALPSLIVVKLKMGSRGDKVSCWKGKIEFRV